MTELTQTLRHPLDWPAPTSVTTYDQPAYVREGPAAVRPAVSVLERCASGRSSRWPGRRWKRAGAPQILIAGGTDDPATPYAWAPAVNQQLAGSVLLTRNGNGHTSYDASTCAHAAIDDYLINLTLPAQGAVCSS
jgi:hypothetical protein